MTPPSPSAGRGAAFAEALSREPGPQLARTGVDIAAVERQAKEALGAAARLQEYRGYLAHARAFKAAGAPSAAAAVDREVLSRGHAMLADMRVLSTSALKTTRSLHRIGALDALTMSLGRAAAAAGTVRVADLWAQVSTGEAREALREAGLTDAVLRTLDESVGALDARVSREGTHVMVVGTFNGGAIAGAIATAPRSARPSGVLDLLTRGRIETLSDAVDRGEPAYLDGAVLDITGAGARPEDLVLHGALAALREGVRHVRKLEDVGLSTYQGGDPVDVLIIFAAAALVCNLTGIIMIHLWCPNTDPPHPADPPVPRKCLIGGLLFLLGLLLFFFGSAVAIEQDKNSKRIGSPTEHAVLMDLEAAHQ